MKHLADTIDFGALMRRLTALPIFGDTPYNVRRGVKLTIVRSLKPQYWRGTAFTSRREIRIVIGQWVTAPVVAELLLHELVHVALPLSIGHNERFRLTLRRAAEQAWGVHVEDASPQRGAHRVSAYALDALIIAQIPFDAVPLLEPRPKRSRAEVNAGLIEKRATHAVRMLAKAERKLRLAKTVATRWRKKVTYYERVAAKKGSS